jgi:hypothetical protein
VRYRITRIAVHQTALVLAVFYGLIAIVAIPFFFLASRAGAETMFPGYLAVIIPPVYALLGYICGAIGCWLYNLVAGWTGGVEMELNPHGNPLGTE